jgi:hypothetical protein
MLTQKTTPTPVQELAGVREAGRKVIFPPGIFQSTFHYEGRDCEVMAS